MHVPATSNDPVLGESLVRMASIPHGTTINAQALAPTSSTAGAPDIPAVDITPFVVGNPGNKIPFIAQTASRTDTPRLPQDLTKFIAEGTITQATLDDPNGVLRAANAGKNIIKTTVFTVATAPTAPVLGGGTANIAFLLADPNGGTNPGPNADAAAMKATFWVEEVEYQLNVPALKAGDAAVVVPIEGAQPTPVFVVAEGQEVGEAKTVKVTTTQIQYSQNVDLNFAGLTWPHVSVATLVPKEEIPVPA